MRTRSARALPILLLALAPLAATAPLAAADLPLLAPLTDSAPLALPQVDPGVPSPADFLGYPLGTRFTQHARILDYLEALAAASPRVHFERYGESYEHRPLSLVAISTPENLSHLDAIVAGRQRLGAPGALSADARARLVAETPLVVWLGYGVHGNESSSSEAAMATAYLLAAGQGEVAQELAHTVVLIDPLLNPDGRERYVHGYQIRRGADPDPDPDAAEHHEDWPGGRGNHYFFDLNRDWAWGTQQETRQRIAAFRRWEPQVYVDFHEMGPESTYFFPPPAEPVHSAIGSSARELHRELRQGQRRRLRSPRLALLHR